MEPGAVLNKEQCPTTLRKFERMRNVPYRSALGAAWYAATVTRPDVTFALSLLSQFAQNPAEVHWRTLQRIIIYLKTTQDHWLVLGGMTNICKNPRLHSHAALIYYLYSSSDEHCSAIRARYQL